MYRQVSIDQHLIDLGRTVLQQKLIQWQFAMINKQKYSNLPLSSNFNSSMKHSLRWNEWFDENVERINVPLKMMKQIKKIQLKKELVAERERSYRGNGPLSISCKRTQYNHFTGHIYPKGDLDIKFLASQGWRHYKAAGDWMMIQPSISLPAFHDVNPGMFSHMNLGQKLSNILDVASLTKPTFIQKCAIPEILTGKNVFIAAETGSGKTLAYLLPMICKIMKWKSEVTNSDRMNTPYCVILAPSKPLVNQIRNVCNSLCEPLDIKVGSVAGKIGGVKEPSCIDILVATPGALAPMAQYRKFDLRNVQYLVLDEGDTLMDDSFSSTVVSIMQKININVESGMNLLKTAQVIIASATMPADLKNIIGDLIDMDAITVIKSPYLHHIPLHVKQRFERVKPSEKSDKVTEVIQRNFTRSRQTLVFCNTASSAQYLAHKLDNLQIEHCLLTGKMRDDMDYNQFESFQKGSNRIMIATDIASRGLDTRSVRHVINFDFPNFISDYIHRIGRVGRVGSPSKCMASSYICKPWEVELLWQIERSIRKFRPVNEINANIKKALLERIHVDSNHVSSDDVEMYDEGA